MRAELPPSEEDWELEATVTRSYDPRAKAEKMKVKTIYKRGNTDYTEIVKYWSRCCARLKGQLPRREKSSGRWKERGSTCWRRGARGRRLSGCRCLTTHRRSRSLHWQATYPSSRGNFYICGVVLNNCTSFDFRVERETGGALRRPTLTPATKSKGAEEMR